MILFDDLGPEGRVKCIFDLLDYNHVKIHVLHWSPASGFRDLHDLSYRISCRAPFSKTKLRLTKAIELHQISLILLKRMRSSN